MERLLNINKDWIDEIWSKTVEKLSRVSQIDVVYYDNLNKYVPIWTDGFWPGIMWLMYEATHDVKFRLSAEKVEEMMDNGLIQYSLLHHEMGFMWHISAGADYRITGSEESKNRNLHAAAVLASRYNVNGRFIKAWNDVGFEGWVIIDTMMNIPLLYWAAEQTNNVAFKKIAMHHADTTLKNHIRTDGSVYHVMNYDIHTGECLGPATYTQGYDAESSSWSRGQALAIYGFVLSYIHTGEQRYLDAAKKVAHYFISSVILDGYIPRADFRAPEEPIYIDTSAAAVAACGLIEIAKNVPELEKKIYMQSAINIMKALTETQCEWSDDESPILQNCTESYGDGVHHPWIYGEYFFVEAMYKLKGFEPLFW